MFLDLLSSLFFLQWLAEFIWLILSMRGLLVGIHASDAVEFCELGGIVGVEFTHLVDHSFASGLGHCDPL
jgi:hypothetical protein